MGFLKHPIIGNHPIAGIHDPKLTRKMAVNLFLLLASVYILTSSGNSVDVTDDGMIRFSVTQRLVEEGRFDLPTDLGKRWGIQGRDGNYYTNHGLGQSVLGIPFYLVGKWTGSPKFMISMMGPLATAASCSLLFLLSLRIGYSLRTAVFVSLTSGLCTQMWPESKSPFDHCLETLSSLLSIYWVYVFLQDKRRGFLSLGGASLGIAVLTRVTSVLWLFPLALMAGMVFAKKGSRLPQFSRSLQNLALFLAGFAPFILVFLWYNQLRFGSVIESGYSVWASEREISNFSNPAYLGIIGELFSPGKGAFVYCPVLILGILAARAFYHCNKPIAILTFFATLIYIVLFAKYVAWHGDIAWGPRYLTLLMPLWMLSMGAKWEGASFHKTASTIAVTGFLIGISFVIQFAGVMVDMNLHYFRLLRLGIIQNVDTYTYPAAIYFDPRYSPLIDRITEVGQMAGWIKQDRRLNGASSTKRGENTPRLDFWWRHNQSAGMPLPFILVLISPFVFEIALCTFRIRNLLRM